MTSARELAHRRRAQLLQELERLWPGCQARIRRDPETGGDRIVVDERLPAPVRRAIRNYVSGWDAGGAAIAANLADSARPATASPPAPRAPARRLADQPAEAMADLP